MTILTVPLTLFPSYRMFLDSSSDRLYCEFVCILFLQTHRETDRFFHFFRSSDTLNPDEQFESVELCIYHNSYNESETGYINKGVGVMRDIKIRLEDLNSSDTLSGLHDDSLMRT